MGHEEELLHVICVLLGCNMENVVEGNLIKISSVKNFLRLMKETAFSHLMEVSSLNSVISIFVNDLLWLSFCNICLQENLLSRCLTLFTYSFIVVSRLIRIIP